MDDIIKYIALVASFFLLYVVKTVYTNLVAAPLSRIPGPKTFALTKWRLAYEDYCGTRTTSMHPIHSQYGQAVRIGPNEVSFNSLPALKTIYGAGTVFQRSDFYRMFDVYGRRNMFTFASAGEHRVRKKLLNHAYSKSSMLSASTAGMVSEKTRQFMKLIEKETDKDGDLEIFNALHYFSLDSITAFLYGKKTFGETSALTSPQDRALLNDIIDPSRRRLSWFTIHFPSLTKWLYSQSSLAERIITKLDLLPMRKPSTYTGIRAHALKAAEALNEYTSGERPLDATASIAERLLLAARADTKAESKMDLLDIASECADQLLAGIDTTSDTIMWAMFLLSLPENRTVQEKLCAEIEGISDTHSNPNSSPEADVIDPQTADKLPYLDAIIKETLRLFAPLPGTEPRFADTDQVIDGFLIPRGTAVSISPYTLHRNADAFVDPENFNPDRWLHGSREELAERNRWFWAFSSGGRMCIGLHLAMAEMTTLLANVYKHYKTEISPRFEGATPGVTARYEVFYDRRFERMEEHACWVRFIRAGNE